MLLASTLRTATYIYKHHAILAMSPAISTSPNLSTAFDLLIASTVPDSCQPDPAHLDDTDESAVLPHIPKDSKPLVTQKYDLPPITPLTPTESRSSFETTTNTSPSNTMSSGNVPSANLIACLESYINPAVPIGTSLSNDPSSPALHIIPSSTLSKLKNLGPARVKDMRSLGHSKQIVSHLPIPASLATCAKFNDALHAATHLNTEKILTLALLPADGKEAAKELQRCVTKMKFVGGVYSIRSTDGMSDDLDDL